jgi:5'-3' exonuclease
MSDRIITFVRTRKYDLTFDEWFEHIEANYEKKLTKEQALKKWEAMCNECGGNEQEIDDMWDLDFDDMEEKLNEIEENVEEDEDADAPKCVEEEEEDAPKCAYEGCENPRAKHGFDPKVCVGKYWALCSKCIKDNEGESENIE